MLVEDVVRANNKPPQLSKMFCSDKLKIAKFTAQIVLFPPSYSEMHRTIAQVDPLVGHNTGHSHDAHHEKKLFVLQSSPICLLQIFNLGAAPSNNHEIAYADREERYRTEEAEPRWDDHHTIVFRDGFTNEHMNEVTYETTPPRLLQLTST